MDFKLHITVHGMNIDVSAGISIKDPYVLEAFAPLRTTDDRFMARITGEHFASDAMYTPTYTIRQGVAADLANTLARHIVAAMESKDTFNGYPIKKG